MPAKPDASAAEKPKPTFVARPLAELPKRETPRTEPDLETANALLAIVQGTTEVDGKPVANTATDGVKYAKAEDARKAANSAKRKLEHVVPDGKRVKSRVWGEENAFEWAVFLADAKPPKPDTNGTDAATAPEATAATATA